jgi:PAS domain S-box-containing protein
MNEPVRDMDLRRVMEEIGLSDRDVADRRGFLELSDADVERLQQVRGTLGSIRESLVEDFYAFMLRHEPLRARLQDPARLGHLKRMQAAYFDSLIDGRVDAAYVEGRLRVGLAHHRIGVAPKWYVGAYRKYLALLLPKLHEAIGGGERFLGILDTLLKLVLFDMGIALEAYFNEQRQELDEAHAYAAQVIGTRPLGIAVVDDRLRIESINRALCLQFGTVPEDVVGLELSEEVVPVAGLAELVKRVRDEGLAVSDWLLRTTPEAELRFFEASMNRLRYHGSERTLVSLTEVTERVKAQEAQKRLRQAVDAIDEMVLIVDFRSLRIVDANASAARRLGYGHEELKELGAGQVSVEWSDEERRERYGPLATGILQALESKAMFRRKDGSAFPASARATLARLGKRAYVVVVARDDAEPAVNGKTRADALLEEIAHGAPAESVLERVARMVESASPGSRCAVLVLGAGGSQVEQVAAPGLGDEYRERMLGQILGPDRGTCGWAIFGTRPIVAIEGQDDPVWRGHPGLGALQDVRACWSIPVTAEAGRVTGMLDVYQSEPREPRAHEWASLRRAAALAAVTIERRRVESAAAQARRELEGRIAQRTRDLEAANRELESFSYSLSHDLRAPLRAVSAFSALLAQEHAAEIPDKARRYLERILASSERASSLVADMLKLFKLGREEMRPELLDLSALVREIANGLREREPARNVVWTIAPGVYGWGDRGLMRIVLTNLLENAWKYSSPRDPAVIEFGTQGSAAQGASAHEIIAFVRDNGVGFDMAFAAKLFGLCQRLHGEKEFPGNGLGLAIVRRVLERHGGRVWAHAEPQRGATFFFALPGSQAYARAGRASGRLARKAA